VNLGDYLSNIVKVGYLKQLNVDELLLRYSTLDNNLLTFVL